ncbi:MAG TPA: carbohydrate-binding family 9-like protein [bacterium]|nr:carbohydrate-binding family 9-like protein [bacterium]
MKLPEHDHSEKRFPKPEIEFQPKSYICYRTSAPIRIDGELTEFDWEKSEWTDDFVDIEGGFKPLPRHRTRAKMLWDDQYLYIAAELEEPHVWATLTQRDTVIFYDNDFEVFIDPNGDSHQYYELEINALGTEWDLLLVKPYRDGGPAINGWDIHGLKTGVHVNGTINQPTDNDVGWTVEIALPWTALRECAHKATPPGHGDIWRINFSRVQWQTEVQSGRYRKIIDPATGRNLPEDNWVWSPQSLIDMHYPEMWGFVQFSTQTIGNGKELFLFPQSEAVKWALRQLYYQQQTHFLNHNSFGNNLAELELNELQVNNETVSPKIKTGWRQFEARLSLYGETWFINQDGKTWQE